MRTLRQAATLLSTATPDGLRSLAVTLGFEEDALPLDATTRASLGLPPELVDVRLARGRGALRALLVFAPGMPLRASFTAMAAALEARSAHVLWTLLGTSGPEGETGIGCWTVERRPPRLLMLLTRPGLVVASDAEALCAMEAASAGDDLMVHTRWCELLGRDALSRRFYRTLEQRVSALARSLPRMPDADLAELSLVAISRLLFLAFLQAKGWLDGDRAFLLNRFERCMSTSGGFHERIMLPLFFGTLNTATARRAAVATGFGAIPFLNGGLFARTALERRYHAARFSDEALGEVFGQLLGAYRFTAREDQAEWSEVAIDPEMLGRAFESLMGGHERRVSGAFYTPQPLVAHVAERALVTALECPLVTGSVLEAALAGSPLANDVAPVLAARLRALTVLDPACGSGAFLVHLLERITMLRRAAGDPRRTSVVRREVLARAIHGVDINPMAVWLCELRLWLSVVIESDETRMTSVSPLPNLDLNVRVGDALSGDAFVAPPSLVGPSAALLRLHERYVRATGAGKAPLRRALAREERRRALAAIERELVAITASRRDALLARRSHDLFGRRSGENDRGRAQQRTLRERAAALRRERRRIADGGALPFSFPSHFARVHARGGFRLIVGNPPWVRLHNIPAASRAALRDRFRVFREPGWDPAPDDGSVQRFAPQVDLAALFVERSLALVSPSSSTDGTGTVALLVPAKLWRSLAGGAVRRLIAGESVVRLLEDWTDAPGSFDAAAYPAVVIASRAARTCDTVLAVRRRSCQVEWSVSTNAVRLDPSDAASPWLLLPPDVRHAFDLLRQRGDPLGRSALGRATLGVKCGCNDAFIVRTCGATYGLTAVEHRGRRGVVEATLLRPLLRGDAVSPWRVSASDRAIVWTHAGSGVPLPVLPGAAARWLAPWKRRLRARTDMRGAGVWWMLFRTDAADCTRTRVVWSDFGRAPRAALLAVGDTTVPLNSCYVMPCDDLVDALALTALLNSAVAASWLNAIAEPARGGWHRYLAWTVALLPLPRDWARARAILAPLTERALVGELPTTEDLILAACHAYGLRRHEVAPLMAWCH